MTRLNWEAANERDRRRNAARDTQGVGPRSVLIRAKYESVCAACGEMINRMDPIRWWPTAKQAFHLGCTRR